MLFTNIYHNYDIIITKTLTFFLRKLALKSHRFGEVQAVKIRTATSHSSKVNIAWMSILWYMRQIPGG